jgi:glutamate formiminotransferase / 5-formyltetrahydrofolate cyclo-ligase
VPEHLVESVPNLSEGRRLDVVDRIAAVVAGTPGVHLLDRTSDADHNRSVLTMAGEPVAVTDALEAMVGVALGEIDMGRHTGEHPRIGAVDVIPFVPLGDMTMAEAVDLAHAFGRRLAVRYDLPVYFYAEAARRQDRVKLADVRRGQYEGLRAEIAQHGREPDEGPARMHPTGGAVAVGARPFLVAWNIDLATDDLEVAKRIARRVRESGGGLPRVQANGFYIAERGRSQVSMNLLDTTITPMWRVWDEVAELAAVEGVQPAESELIGLAPLAAFTAVADHAGASPGLPVERRFAAAAEYLRLRDADPAMALELRLAAATAGSQAGRPHAGRP